MSRFAVLAMCALPFVAHAQLPQPTSNELRGVRSLALSPDGSKLAFVYRGDIWLVSSAGGLATALTSHVEMEDNPVWSPDGNWIAFSSNRNGNNDIYVMPINGGESRRLTWHSASDVPRDWSPDGKSILFTGTRDGSEPGAFTLDVNTLQTKLVFRDFAAINTPKFTRDGKGIVYNRFGFAWTRPRYQGSGASQIWAYDMANAKRTKIRDTTQQHLWPTPIEDGSILAVTVTEKTPSSSYLGKPIPKIQDNVSRTPNIYQITGSGAKRLTDSIGEPIRFLTSAKNVYAYERQGFAYTVRDGKTQKLTLVANLDDRTTREERLILTNGVTSSALNPAGDSVIFSVRGELWQVPVKKGKGPNADDARQLTDYPGVDEQPVYAADGLSVFFISDREGAKRIYRLNPETKEVKPFTTDDNDHNGLSISPDKRFLVYWRSGPEGGLFRVPVTGGTPVRLVRLNHNTPYSFSPDGRYVAYSRPLLGTGINPWDTGLNIFVKEIATDKEFNVTGLNAIHSDSAWSADGKYLYFRSNRDGDAIYALPLSDEDARTTELELKFEKPKEIPKTEFNFEDTQFRIRKLLEGPCDGNLRVDPTTGELLFLRGGDVWKVNYNGEESRQITSGGGIGKFEFTPDFNHLHFVKNGIPGNVNLRAQNFPLTTVGFRADWVRDIRAERLAAFREFWSIYNRTFYDPNFHGRDWTAIRKRYEPLMDSVGHRAEMATVLNMMVGELEASHTEASSAPGDPSSQTTAHLGFTIDYSHSGQGLKVLEVPKRSPGGYSKTLIKSGEYVLRVNGEDVKAVENLFKVLNEQAGREVILLVNGSPSKTGARTVKYRALSQGEWSNINYRNRIDARRLMVDRLSGGRVAYLHIAGMGGGNLATFQKEAWQFVQGKKAVILDVRENGGGNIADTLLDMLERMPQARYLPRDGEEVTAPGASWGYPTVVMHAESSFSNAEMFPAMMKSRKLATLVGRPTPGYVIYTNGYRLVDGTSARLPNTSVNRVDGSPMENMGQDPDFDVMITPEQYFSGKDPQIEKSVELLLKQIGG